MFKSVLFSSHSVPIKLSHILCFGSNFIFFTNSQLNKNFSTFFNIFIVFKKILIYINSTILSFLNPLFAVSISIEDNDISLFGHWFHDIIQWFSFI